MSTPSRQRLARIVREPGCDLAEAALLCCVEVEPDLDVEVELLRLDALADGLRTSREVSRDDPHAQARALAGYLARDLGFAGDEVGYHDPRNGLLTAVLDRRRGLPITLSIVYVAIGRRARIRAFGLNTPGHFLVGVGQPGRPVVLDPFHGGAVLEATQLDALLQRVTGGAARLAPSMLRPTPAAVVLRRLLDNLTRDFLGEGDVEDALWTVELKLLLPGSLPDDLRVAGELLVQLGRFRDAARTFDRYGERAPTAADGELAARLALDARARMN